MWLCGLATLNVDIGAELLYWRESTSVAAAMQLAHFVSFDDMGDDDDSPSFWSDVDATARTVVANWRNSSSTRAQIEAAMPRVDANDAWMLETALKTIRKRNN